MASAVTTAGETAPPSEVAAIEAWLEACFIDHPLPLRCLIGLSAAAAHTPETAHAPDPEPGAPARADELL